MTRVLIVDDHAIVRRGLKEILAAEPDLEVHDTPNPRQVMKLIRDSNVELVVLDLDLPGSNGIDLLKKIKGAYPKLPVLILSVYPEEQFAVRTLKAGASGYLSKDTAPEDLVKAIRTILRGGKYISECVAERLLYHVTEDEPEHPHDALSDREFQILSLFGSGKTVSEIASDLSLSVTTISTYRARILEKMRMKTTAELMRYAIENRLAR